MDMFYGPFHPLFSESVMSYDFLNEFHYVKFNTAFSRLGHLSLIHNSNNGIFLQETPLTGYSC